MKAKINIGDKVKLISKRKVKRESSNWLNFEEPIPQIGDTFLVITQSPNGNWISLRGLKFDHSSSKFEKVID